MSRQIGIDLHVLAIIAGVTIGLQACGGGPAAPTPPVTPVDPLRLSCPADMTVRGTTGASQPVLFPPPTPTGGTTPISVTCTPGSGSTFNVGNTSATCTATDSSARQAACSFNVMLIPVVLGVTRFLAYGDSVTTGQNGRFAFGRELIDVPNAYPTKLQALFDLTYPNQGIVVANQGVGGESVEDANARLPGVLALERPGALLFIDGYNNLLAECGFAVGVTPKCASMIDFVAGKLREGVRIARNSANGVSYVFVGTLTPPGPLRGPFDRRIAAAAVDQVNARIRQQIPAEGAVVVDAHPLFLGHENEYVAPDGLHLEPAGNQVLADAFFAAIKATLPQMVSLTDLSRR